MRTIVIGMSGASGVIHCVRLLETLRDTPDVETHLILTEGARKTLALETDFTAEQVEALADRVHAPDDLAAPVASGSFLTDGMAVVPCSMKTLSAIAHSYTENLLVRAADVVLKERRPLVLSPRETPLHKGHLKNMLAAAELGAVLLPPMTAFYHRPATLDEVVDQTVGRILDALGVDNDLVRRWEGADPKGEKP